MEFQQFAVDLYLFWPIHRQESEYGILAGCTPFQHRNQQYSQPPTYSRLNQQEALQNVTGIPLNYSRMLPECYGFLTLSPTPALGPSELRKPYI